MSLFIATALSVWAAMHAYVFWRLASLPWVDRNLGGWKLALIGFVFWAMFPLSRFLEGRLPEQLSLVMDYVASNWIGILFLLMCCFLTVDIFTLGGVLFKKWMPQVRTWTVGVAFVLAAIALIQGHRDPVVTAHEIRLKNLPPEKDGMVIVAISDLHLGGLIRDRWLERMTEKVRGLKPDLILVVGDLIDGNVPRVRFMASQLRVLQAPLGVWGVTGNHDFYAGLRESVEFFQNAGVRLLRDESVELAPGLRLSGVDDLTARLQFGLNGKPLETALATNDGEATIFLSHSPMLVEDAAARGANLMISGHTHNGQVWPFTYLVQLRYPRAHGRYEVNGMTLLVGRGAATWGPRMRLWPPGEVLKITLRSGA